MAYPSQFSDIYGAVVYKARLSLDTDLVKAKDWVNQAYYQACVETDFLETSSTTVALTAAQTSINVPTGIISIEYIVPTGNDGSTWGTMDMVQFNELLDMRAWQGATV